MEAQRMHHVHALTASVLLRAQGGVPSPEDQKNGGSCARRLADVMQSRCRPEWSSFALR